MRAGTLGAGNAATGSQEEVRLEHHITGWLSLWEEAGSEAHLMAGAAMVNWRRMEPRGGGVSPTSNFRPDPRSFCLHIPFSDH